MNITVDDFLRSLQLGTYKWGFVLEEHIEEIKSHPAFNIDYFIEPCEPAGIDCPDQRHGYFIYDKWGWQYLQERRERERPKEFIPPPPPVEDAKYLSKQLRIAIDKMDFVKVKEIRDKLKPLLIP